MVLGSCSLGPSLAYGGERVWSMRCIDPLSDTVRWIEVTQHPDNSLTCPDIGSGRVVWDHWAVGSFDQDHVYWIFEGGEVVFEFYGRLQILDYIRDGLAISKKTGRAYSVSGKIIR